MEHEGKLLFTTYGIFKTYDNTVRNSSAHYDLNIKYPDWKKKIS